MSPGPVPPDAAAPVVRPPGAAARRGAAADPPAPGTPVPPPAPLATASTRLRRSSAPGHRSTRRHAHARRRRRGQLRQLRRHRLHRLGRQPPFAGQPVPAGIGAHRQHEAEQDQRPGRQPTLRQRGRKIELGPRADLRRLGLEAAHRLVGVEAERGGIGAQEGKRVGAAGQRVDSPVFQRFQIGHADAQHAGHFRHGAAQPLARDREFGADPRRRQAGVRHQAGFHRKIVVRQP